MQLLFISLVFPHGFHRCTAYSNDNSEIEARRKAPRTIASYPYHIGSVDASSVSERGETDTACSFGSLACGAPRSFR